MECKKALTEAEGDLARAEELLRVKLGNKASKAASRVTAEGVIASFIGGNGQGPTGALVMDSNGNLYGTEDSGSDSDVGTVFELAKGSGTITTLAQTVRSQTSLVMDGSGNLYGTTLHGGATGFGTVSKRR